AASGRSAVDPRSVPNPKAEAAVEHLKEKFDRKAAQRAQDEQAEIDYARRALREPDLDEIDPAVAADLEAAGESLSKDTGVKLGRDPRLGTSLRATSGTAHA